MFPEENEYFGQYHFSFAQVELETAALLPRRHYGTPSVGMVPPPVKEKVDLIRKQLVYF